MTLTDLFKLCGKDNLRWDEPSYQYTRYYDKEKVFLKLLKYNYQNFIPFEIRRMEIYLDGKLASEYYHAIADVETLAKLKIGLPRVLNQFHPITTNSFIQKDNFFRLIRGGGQLKLQPVAQARKELKEWVQATVEQAKRIMASQQSVSEQKNS